LFDTLYLSSTSIIYISAVSPLNLWNSITLVWTTFLGIKYRTSTRTNFRLLWFEVSPITDIYFTVSSSSKISCMAKGVKTFTTIASHFVLPHENFLHANFLSLRMYNPRSKGTVMFNFVECKQSFFGCNVFVLIGYCLLGEMRRYFLTATRIPYSSNYFLCCSISDRPPCTIENSDLHMVQNTYPTCWSSFINGYSAFRFSVKTQFLFGIFMGFLFPTVHTWKCSCSYNDYTTQTEPTMRRETAEKTGPRYLKARKQ
jgi:hypothetical protein